MTLKINTTDLANPFGLEKILNAIQDQIDNLITLTTELRADHATFKASVDEIETWAETLATKLNNDGGVTDVDYDTTITNSAPATISAAAVTASVDQSGS